MPDLTIDAELLELFRQELHLCKVREGEVVAVLSAGNERPDYAQGFMLAAQGFGASALHVNVTRTRPSMAGVPARHPLEGNPAALETLKRADMVIDLMGLLFSREQAEIQAAGARILRVVEPPHILRQMFPTEDLRRRVEFEKAMLESAKELRFTSPGGTDLTYALGQYPVMSEYGYTYEKGRWDHFPSGFAFTHGNDGKVDGKVVLMPGDIFAAFKRYVQAPVTLTVRGGSIVDIRGEGMDAVLLRNYIESFKDPRGYAISHIGWGLNERANWHQFAASPNAAQEYVMNALSFYGNVLFSTGPNTELGGTNDTPCHMDMPMRGCSLWVDDVQILDEGKVVHPEMRAPER
jgi:2,5-dihydroxypyridine 5,6-dioxygenase